MLITVRCVNTTTKLEINFTENPKGENPWHCWACDIKGKTIASLFKSVKAEGNKYSELNSILGTTTKIDQSEFNLNVELPKEYKPLHNLSKTDIIAKHALSYVKKRGITPTDVLKYQIGYCETGKYRNSIIVPSYDKDGQSTTLFQDHLNQKY